MKIYLKKAAGARISSLKKIAGNRAMLGLKGFRQFIESISISLDEQSGAKRGTLSTCRFLIYTVHGGVILITSRGSRGYMAVARAIKKSRAVLRDTFTQFVLSGQQTGQTRLRLATIPIRSESIPVTRCSDTTRVWRQN